MTGLCLNYNTKAKINFDCLTVVRKVNAFISTGVIQVAKTYIATS